MHPFGITGMKVTYSATDFYATTDPCAVTTLVGQRGKILSPGGFHMSIRRVATVASIAIISCVASAMASSAPTTFTKLYTFCHKANCADGSLPVVGLVQGTDGNLYGTTWTGGNPECRDGCGTIFKITPEGQLTTLYKFCSKTGCTDGSGPYAPLLQATDGSFYGTTLNGGGTGCDGSGCGTVFKMSPAGKLTTLYEFCTKSNCSDGAWPNFAMVQATDGNIYGTTALGGNSACPNGCGTAFKITPDGKLTTLHAFCSKSNCIDGSSPQGIVQGTDRNFYGVTSLGGENVSGCDGFGCGTVFKMTPQGKSITLYSFCSQANCTDGSFPLVGLLQATDGNLYGTTLTGGDDSCVPPGGCGTVFKITNEGKLTTLHRVRPNEGYNLGTGLLQATDGNFYGGTGTTFCVNNICNSVSTLFKMTPAGKFMTLHRCANKCDIPSQLVQATNGILYGTASSNSTPGSVFSLSLGLGPFVATNPTSGKVRMRVAVLGNNLNASTSVAFNGVAAQFKVVSDTEISTTVPTGATTGFVSVTTTKGKLKSNVVFRVIK